MRLSLKLPHLTSALARDLNVAAGTQGVVVTSVGADSPAAIAELKPGDLIRPIHRKLVRNVDDFHRAIQRLHGKTVLLSVDRGRSPQFPRLKPQ